jgi:predicted acylesterase/phospholipase RssA
MVATRTDAELAATTAAWLRCRDSDFFGAPKSLAGLARSLWARGTLHDAREFGERLARLFGDLTFAEAYQRSGRILNIAVTAADTREPPRLLNYLTAPHCVVRSAVAASSAFPFLFAPQELLAKDGAGRVAPYHAAGAGAGAGAPGAPGAPALRRWADGSLEEDLPMRGLSEQFGGERGAALPSADCPAGKWTDPKCTLPPTQPTNHPTNRPPTRPYNASQSIGSWSLSATRIWCRSLRRSRRSRRARRASPRLRPSTRARSRSRCARARAFSSSYASPGQHLYLFHLLFASSRLALSCPAQRQCPNCPPNRPPTHHPPTHPPTHHSRRSGDVNFVLPAMAFGNLLRSATNFSRREITRAMREGQRSVWARREAVRAGGAVEVAIDAALAELAGRAAAASRRDAAAAAAAAVGRRRGSLPSWMDLKSLGLPSSESADELGGGRGSLGAIAELAGPPPLRVHAEEGGGSSDGGERSGAEEAEDGGDAAAAAGEEGAATPRDARPSWAAATPESPLLEGGLEALRDLSAAFEGGGTALDLISP